MEMYQLALTIIWITSLALPYLVFAINNPFRNPWLTLLRAVVAVGIGWAFMLAYVFTADAINHSLALTQERIDTLNNTDGAKFSFALLFGWVMPAIIVSAGWLLHVVILRRLSVKRSNKTPK
jgi:hypothetical protein